MVQLLALSLTSFATLADALSFSLGHYEDIKSSFM